MIVYLYAIADGLSSIEDLHGTSGERLSVHACEGLDVVAGELDAMPSLDEASLTMQDNVVRGLHARAAGILPMRFGAAFRSIEDMKRAVALQTSSLRDKLDRVAGKDQMTMRALRPPGAVRASDVSGEVLPKPATGAARAKAAASGAEYLRQRAKEQRPFELEPLLTALDPLQRATRIERGKAPGVIATVYQLIEKGTSDAYREAASRAAKELPGVRIHVSGPSPCYAFT